MKKNQKLSAKQIKIQNELWRRGELIWLLRPSQRLIYAALKDSLTRGDSLKYFLNCSRRFGKSFFLCVLACEYTRKFPEYPVRFAAPTIKSLKKIVRPHFRRIFQTAPDDCKPEWRGQDDMYYFPHTGAEINIAGVNNGHEDDLRGTEAGLCLVDEAQAIDNLEYLVEDVLMPQLLTTGGNMVMSGTPPRSPAHKFAVYAAQARAAGNYSEFNIHQAGYSPQVIGKFKKEAGGENSTTWKREYMCQFVVDEETAIVPEWKDEYAKEVNRDAHLFQFFHLYEAMDVGGRDKNATLFAYYDFPNARLIVEDEVVLAGEAMTTGNIARTIKVKERELWPERIPKGQPETTPEEAVGIPMHRRVADNNNVILLRDLGREHGLHFMPTSKDDLIAMVNQVRMWVQAGRLIVHPRCQQLIGCLKFGIWTANRDKFEKSAAFGHFDALAALVYLIRNCDTFTNPIPITHDRSAATHFMIPGQETMSPEAKALKELFGPRHGAK